MRDERFFIRKFRDCHKMLIFLKLRKEQQLMETLFSALKQSSFWGSEKSKKHTRHDDWFQGRNDLEFFWISFWFFVTY